MADERAKELFFAYDGSHCFMANDGVLDAYLSCGVSRAQEKEWLIEIESRKAAALDHALSVHAEDMFQHFASLCLTVARTKNTAHFRKLFGVMLSESERFALPQDRFVLISSFTDLMRSMKGHIDLEPYKLGVRQLTARLEAKSDDSETKRKARWYNAYLDGM